jgi:hypothetical protein
MLRSIIAASRGQRGRRQRAAWVRRAALRAVVLAQIACACLADAPGEVIEEFDVNRGGDLVTVPVNIDGRNYRFDLDTGASGWVFDDSLRRLLGPVIDRVTIKAGGFSLRTDLYAMPAMRIGGMAVDSSAGAACAPLRESLLLDGLDVYGGVCTKFLRDKIFQVDFDAGKLRFVSHVPQDAGERLPLGWKDHLPYLELDLGGAGKEEFQIDTGYCSLGAGSLREALWEQLAASGGIKPLRTADAEVRTVLGARSTRHAKIDCFRVGPFSHQGLVFQHSERSTLGLGYLSRYVVTFDFTRSAIYLKPGREYARRDRHDLAEIAFVGVDGKTLVGRVGRDGAADRAGLKDRDELVEVDGVPARKMSAFGLCRLFATPGERRVRYTRKVGRAVQQREATLVLTDTDDG